MHSAHIPNIPIMPNCLDTCVTVLSIRGSTHISGWGCGIGARQRLTQLLTGKEQNARRQCHQLAKSQRNVDNGMQWTRGHRESGKDWKGGQVAKARVSGGPRLLGRMEVRGHDAGFS